MRRCAGLWLALPLLANVALAGEADVLGVDVSCKPAPGGRSASICQFSVTVRHGDQGWEHYVNRWEIVDPEGKVIATRVLRHPHVEEQPFRRSMGRIRIQHAMPLVIVRASDGVHGTGGREIAVQVPHAEAPRAQ